VLVKAGWHVETAANGRIGLEYLARQVPSLVLLDLMMPEMDGFEFLENMHRRAEWRDVPVVVVTAKVLSEEDHDRLNGYVEFVAQKGGEAGGLAVSDVTRLLERALDRERRSGRDRRRLRASRHVQLDAGAAPRDEQPTGTARLRSGERRVAADRRTEADRRSNPHGSAGPDSRSDR
jgi:CheY-like chemotaxis protein